MNTKNMIMSDERQCIRSTQHNILRCEKYTLRDNGMKQKLNTITKNVSANGVLFGSKQEYNISDVVKLEIDFPGWEKFKIEFHHFDYVSQSKPIVVLGSVVRVDTVKPGLMFDVGVRFVGIDKGHQLALKEYLNDQVNRNE